MRAINWTALTFAFLVAACASAARAEGVEGRWLTQGKSGVVEIYRCGDAGLCGRLVWYRVKPSDTDPQTDLQNPTPALRNRPLCGLIIMWGLRPDGPGRWVDGSLYDPESGNTYSGNVTLRPDGTLSLRGYIAISLFGRSENWTRFSGTIDRCPSG